MRESGQWHFTAAHCASGDAGDSEYEHVAFAEKTSTALTARNRETSGALGPWKLKSEIGGAPFELEIGEVSFVGLIENVTVALEPTVIGTGYFFFRKITVLTPAKSGCVVKLDKQPGIGNEGEFESNKLQFLSAQQGDALNFTRPPMQGEVLATFYLQGCTNGALNATYELKGTFKSTSIDGATIKFTHTDTTNQKTLKLGAAAAGFEGTITSEAKPAAEEGAYTPLSFTTVTI